MNEFLLDPIITTQSTRGLRFDDVVAAARAQAAEYRRMNDINVLANGGGLSRSKDYGSKKKPYPSVKSGDFAGGGRSYPIPTKADAVDALRLAGLHHRADVKAKVYRKYPSLKHAEGGLLNGPDNPDNPHGLYGPYILPYMSVVAKKPNIRQSTKRMEETGQFLLNEFKSGRLKQLTPENKELIKLANFQNRVAGRPDYEGIAKTMNEALTFIPFGSEMLPVKVASKVANKVSRSVPTLEKALKFTNKKWDELYFKALKNNDFETVQKIRDLHFSAKSNTSVLDESGNPLHVYHGSPEKNITVFRHKPPRSGGRGTGTEGFYFSPKKSYADRYQAEHLLKSSGEYNGKTYDVYLNAKNIATFPDFPMTDKIDAFQHMNLPERLLLENSGYDAVKMGKFFNNFQGKRPEIAVLNPEQIKLADAITYDNSGNIIPLSKRDNFLSNDIRYGLSIPIGLGLGIEATVNN